MFLKQKGEEIWRQFSTSVCPPCFTIRAIFAALLPNLKVMAFQIFLSYLRKL
jgi:hypothetical protein